MTVVHATVRTLSRIACDRQTAFAGAQTPDWLARSLALPRQPNRWRLSEELAMYAPSNFPKTGSNTDKATSPEHSHAPLGVSREFHNLLADIEDLIKEATSLTGEDLAAVRSKLTARIAEARASAQVMSDGMVQRARQTAGVANDYVHEQPWKALGASAVAAFLLGFILARRG